MAVVSPFTGIQLQFCLRSDNHCPWQHKVCRGFCVNYTGTVLCSWFRWSFLHWSCTPAEQEERTLVFQVPAPNILFYNHLW